MRAYAHQTCTRTFIAALFTISWSSLKTIWKPLKRIDKWWYICLVQHYTVIRMNYNYSNRGISYKHIGWKTSDEMGQTNQCCWTLRRIVILEEAQWLEGGTKGTSGGLGHGLYLDLGVGYTHVYTSLTRDDFGFLVCLVFFLERILWAIYTKAHLSKCIIQ